MAAQGMAKRATIGIGFHLDQQAIDKFEHSLEDINRDNTTLRDTFDLTNRTMESFNQHMSSFANRHGEMTERIKQQNHALADSTRTIKRLMSDSSAPFKRQANTIDETARHEIETENQKYHNLADNEHKIAERLSETTTNARHNEDKLAQENEHLRTRMSNLGSASEHMSNRMASANGRVAHSYHYANSGLDQHIESIRRAQGRSYRWLRTCQDMAGATLGLGAAFYKGAKEATTLQQSYIHAGNMAHYGGEKMKQVQHDINDQWRVGSNLSTRYGISQKEIAQGYQALVARGYTTNESLHTQKSLLQASIASGDNYNDVVKDSTNVLDAYNLRSQNATTMTNNTKKVVNEMAYAADQTATNFQGLGIGMSYVAATAHTTHQSISETSSALGILSNKGMQASQAGVGLRKVYNSFLSVNKKGQQAQAMQQMGLSENDFKTASGHLKSLGSLMSLMNDKTKNMDSQQRGAIFHRFFGATGQEAALNLASDTKGLAQLNRQVKHSQNMHGGKGYVAVLSAHNMKSAQNQINRFRMAWQAFTVTSAREILPSLTGLLKHIDKIIFDMNKLSPAGKKWLTYGALAIAGISPLAGVIFGIKSAFHGLEMTIARVRRLFARPVSHTMQDSMGKQGLEDDAAGKILGKSGTSAGTLSRVAKYDKGGLLSNITDHPVSVGAGSAATLAIGMGTFMGLNANHEAAKQVHNKLKHEFHSPIQESIKAELDKASVNRSLETNKHFTKQMRNQDTHIYKDIDSQINNKNRLNLNASKRNIANLRKYGAISKHQARQLLRNDTKTNNKRSKNAKSAIERINWDERHGHKISQKDYKDAAKAMNRIIAGNGSKQAHIFKRLQKANGKISTQTASKLLKNAYKSYKGQVRNANNTYTNAKSDAWKRYNTVTKAAAAECGYGTNKYNEIAKKAEKTRKSTIHGAYERKKWTVYYAKQEHDKTISEAEKQHRGLNKQIDLTTGHMKTELSSSVSWIKNHFINPVKGLFSSLSNIHLPHLPSFHNISSAANNASEFGKTRTVTHANGGAISHNEMSLVNEKGQESAYNPHTNSFRLLGNNGPQVLKLYAGEHVLDAHDTSELLSTGLGKGVTLPGYANGTDRLSNIHGIIHGYAVGTGRSGAISSEEASDPRWIQDLDRGGFKNGIDFSAPWLNIPHDLSGMKANPIHSVASAATDAPGLGWLGHTAHYLRGMDMSKSLVKPFTLGAHAVRHMVPPLKSLHEVMHPVSSLMGKIPLHDAAKGMLKKIPGDFSKIAPLAKKGISFAKGKLKGYTHNLISSIGPEFHKGINKLKDFGHTIARGSGRIWRSGKRLLSRAGHGIAKFGRHAWSGAKRLGSRLWSGTKHVSRRLWSATKRTGKRMWNGTKHVAGRMWRSAKRTGRNIWRSTKRVGRNVWNDSKRVARNVDRGARRLWSATKRGASRTWSGIKSGASRMASRAKSIAGHAWSGIKSGARTAKNVADGMMNGIVNFAHRAAHAIKRVVTLGGLIGHHANGGAITHNQLSLVGEHGLETAYNPRSGVIRLLGTHGPQITELLAGERVLTNTQTNKLLHGGLGSGIRLPGYAKGTGAELDNSRYHGPSRGFGINAVFSGRNALRSLKLFGKKSGSIWKRISRSSTHNVKSAHNNNLDEWQKMYKELGKVNTRLSKDTRDTFKDMSDKVSKLVDDLHSGLVNAAKDMASGFGDKFSKLITYAKNDMESVIDKLNRGVSGINVALKAFGGNSHVIHAIHYATGSGFLMNDQIGILNDATQGPKQESILRNGRLIFPHGDNVHVPLRRGDAVLNGDQTKEISNITNINHYKKGSGLHLNFKHIGKLVKLVGQAIKHPLETFDKYFEHPINPSGTDVTSGFEDMAKRPFSKLGNTWTSAMFKFIKSLISNNGTSGTGNAFVRAAMKYGSGGHYVWGASGPHDFDCSGLVQYTLEHAFGISAPKPSGHQISMFPHVSKENARPGDLIGNSEHIGIVEDNGAHHYFSAFSPSVHPNIRSFPVNSSYFPGTPTFARIPKLAKQNKPKSHHVPMLEKLVKSELGPVATHWLKKAGSILSEFGDIGPGSNPAGDSIGRWRPYVKRALSALHLSTGDETVARVLRQINTESSGDPHAIGGTDGLNDGHAMGLMQVKPGTFAAYRKPSLGKWDNGLASIYAGLNYAKHRYGSLDVLGNGHGYANGGWTNKPSIFGEAGPEVAINPQRDTADHLIIQAIGARMKNSPGSPIAGLVKSLDLKHKSHKLISGLKGLLTGNPSPKPKQNNSPIKINVTNNITVQGNPSSNTANKITRNVERAIRRGVQHAALQTRNRIDW